MARFEGNPILRPVKEHPWESNYVLNPAMFELGGRIHFIYRAIGEDTVSRLGYASSREGYHIDERLDHPIFEPANYFEEKGCEDPRVTVMGGRCVMTYTAYNDVPQIGITTIPAQGLLGKKWKWGERIHPFPNVVDKNAVIFSKRIKGCYAMLHRREPNMYISYSEDLRNWDRSKLFMRPRKNNWDSLKVGAAGPPIELDIGWLQMYHGVDEKRTYRLGAVLLDKENPERITFRSEEPFLEPEEDYEFVGCVPNVVFSCGAVLIGDKIIVSYGCADSVTGVSTFRMDEILK